MTRKDYVLIAELIRMAWENAEFGPVRNATMIEVIETMATGLREQNPRFDPEKFRKACTPEK